MNDLRSESIAIINSLEFIKQFFIIYKPIFLDFAGYLEADYEQEEIILKYSGCKIAFLAQKIPFNNGSCEKCIDRIINTISQTLNFLKMSKDISYYLIYKRLCGIKKEIEKFKVYQVMIEDYKNIFVNVVPRSKEELQQKRERYFDTYSIRLGFYIIKELQKFIDYLYKQSKNTICNTVLDLKK